MSYSKVIQVLCGTTILGWPDGGQFFRVQEGGQHFLLGPREGQDFCEGKWATKIFCLCVKEEPEKIDVCLSQIDTPY